MIVLPGKLVKKLRRESGASGIADAFEILLAESVARRWFLAEGLPCWRSPQPPLRKGRYGLLFPSGRRALVSPRRTRRYSFDDIAAAKCDYLVSVSLSSDASGTPEGFLIITDIFKPENPLWIPDISTADKRPIKEFPELGMKPGHFRLSYIIGSLKLLALSEPRVPPPRNTATRCPPGKTYPKGSEKSGASVYLCSRDTVKPDANGRK